MKRESMNGLVEIYMALQKFNDLTEIMFNELPLTGYHNSGLYGKFHLINEIIKAECNQSLVDEDADIDDREYIKILRNESLTVEEKVDLLFY